MSTNEFDRLIAKNVSRVSYEYDADDWEKLTMQLAAARRKKRAIVFVYLSSGIAASIAIFIIGIIAMRAKKEMPVIQYASKPHTPPAAPLALSANRGVIVLLAGAQHTGHYHSSAINFHKEQAQNTHDTVASNAPVVYNNLAASTLTPAAKTWIDTTDLEQKSKQHSDEVPISLSYTETKNTAGHSGINLSVAGGLNYGAVNTGYAIGAAAGKKLSKKIGVEVMVAYVGNTASGSQYSSQPPPSGSYIPPPMGPLPVATSSSRLNYLQFAPMADYSISKKITLSAGADLQRLLQEHGATVLYNDNTRFAPLIDIGMLLRTEYAISHALKAGLSYRVGANNIVSPGNNYFDRNYMQIQLKYTVH